MVLALDSRFPLVWRSPDSLQIGVDRPLAVIDPVSRPIERMLAALTRGISRSGLSLVASEGGGSELDAAALLVQLGPAVVEVPGAPAAQSPPTAPPLGAVALDGTGGTLRRLAALAPDLGIRTAHPSDVTADLAVIVAHYAVAPARYGGWLRRDIPHLPIVFSDTEVRIGPFVEPGDGPCLYCVDRGKVDEDAAWPAMASQLVTRTAPTETPVLALETAVRAGRLLERRLRHGENPLHSAIEAIDATSGRISRAECRPHASCACRSL
ncbi:hypothetical protein [Compostimonas suwonensis]|uniref:Bacteriocin biosynthesis cyclodehydratase domain-containing protein n=1 Tax=Compostimonas suwonensis TaxID=1048394 RepID=A0A2M9BWF6_9MICO|nr:hypothetical protein [Compostimonas suwonensis]PJJ62286.1 bacteriocin biosynthesis cyclodehydratase domain-containing protein [Compostimonas suwonensis]